MTHLSLLSCERYTFHKRHAKEPYDTWKVSNADACISQGINQKPETYLFRGGELMTVMGNNFGVDAQVAIGPDPNTGVIYYCNFTRPFEINTRDCRIEGKGYECLFCRLRAGMHIKRAL